MKELTQLGQMTRTENELFQSDRKFAAVAFRHQGLEAIANACFSRGKSI